MQYQRWQKDNLREALATWRVVMLTGPRQCGKTTLSRAIVSDKTEYLTLDDPTMRLAAEADPLGFVTHMPHRETLIIDEVQKVPDLLSAVKQVVDKDNRPGQFLLTGSARIQSLPTVSESLAGRVGRIRLRPLSQGEIEGRVPRPDFLENAFNGIFPQKLEDCDKAQLVARAFRGGFPEALRLPEKKVRLWHRNYIKSLLERDLLDIANISKAELLYDLVSVMASWSSKYMETSAICSALGINRKTLQGYIAALGALFIVETVPAWTKTDYARIGKRKKSFMTDTGLMTSLLAWSADDLWMDSDRTGKLMESFVYQELAALTDCAETEYRLYHYRDREKREIDFLIEREDRALLGIEIKSGATVRGEDARHLLWFSENLAQKAFTGVILYTGKKVVPLGKNIWAVPLSALWSR